MFTSILVIDKLTTDFDGKIKVAVKNELGEAISATQLTVKRCKLIQKTNMFPLNRNKN